MWETPYAYPLSGYRSGLGRIHTRDLVDNTVATVSRWAGYPNSYSCPVFATVIHYLYITWATFHSDPFSFLFCVHIYLSFSVGLCINCVREIFGKGRATPCRARKKRGGCPPLSGLLGNSVAIHLIHIGVGWVAIGYRFI